ncbi:MAG: hypothetical protein EXR85_02305 [Xanthomonadales bacterium]|nr:hypothetical protein [Xanthomonadales bacterium]
MSDVFEPPLTGRQWLWAVERERNALKLADTLQGMEDLEKRLGFSLNIEGSGTGNKNKNIDILSGGGKATLNIPVGQGWRISPSLWGSGAYGSVNTPEGKMNIRERSPLGRSVYLKYTSPF